MSGFQATFRMIRDLFPEAAFLGPSNGSCCGVSTDTRTLRAGQLFAALSGERFDGNRFAAEALRSGASGALLTDADEMAALHNTFPQAALFLVPDGLYALGELARFWRSTKTVHALAVTGSNGKTTTKEIIAAILSAHGSVLKTEGNLNNRIGLPLTLFGLSDEPFAVLEMGMSEPGEIARLAQIAMPEIGVITNVHAAHLESMGDLEAVARAKGELFDALDESHTAIVNLDNPRTAALGKNVRARIVTFSLSDPAADYFADSVEDTENGQTVRVAAPDGSVTIRLPLPGRHNAANLLAAMAVCGAAGFAARDMIAGAERVSVPGRRLKVRRDIPGLLLIDDGYNANPASMEAALELLVHIAAGRKVAVLGDMLELGVQSPELHRQTGAAAARLGVTELLLLGERAQDVAKGASHAGMPSGSIRKASDWEELAGLLRERVKPGDSVLVKGSRGMRMERATEELARLFGKGN